MNNTSNARRWQLQLTRPCGDYGHSIWCIRSLVAAPRVVVETAQVRRRTLSVQFRHMSAFAQCRHVIASFVVRQTDIKAD